MERFDIYQVRGGLALDCQADILHRMPTRFVVPLEPPEPSLVVSDQLNPRFALDDQPLVMVTQLAGTIRKREIQRRVSALTDEREQMMVQRALEMLATGV